MKISNTLIVSIASILIVAICAGTILRLHENLGRIDTAVLSDKDKIEMLVTLNSHRLELVKTIMDGDTIYSDEEIKFFDELLEKEGLEKFNEIVTYDAADGYWKSKEAKQILERAIFLERAMNDIVMNDSLIKQKRMLEIFGF